MKKLFAAIVAVMSLTTAVAFAGGSPQFDTPYIGNSLRGTYHVRDCDSVWQMWVEHQVPIKSRAEAIAAGYHPCGNCRPDLRSDLP